MKTTNLTCINCPLGCQLTVIENNGNYEVSGHTCKRGYEYAINEMTNPKRTITSIVKVSNRDNSFVSVKTESPISKPRIFEAMEQIRNATIEAPVNIGDTVIEDLIGETKLIATSIVK